MRVIATILLIMVLVPAIHAAVIYVPDDYPTINQGIAAAGSGDTVWVGRGTYEETITVGGDISLIGEAGYFTPVIDAGGAWIAVRGGGALVKRFVIRNADYGVKAEGGLVIDDCKINDCTYGVWIDSRQNTVTKTEITNTGVGIYFFFELEGTGEGYEGSSQAEGERRSYIYGNVISGNIISYTNHGIWFHSWSTHLVDNLIKNNSIEGNMVGVHLERYADSNVITRNTIAWNSGEGFLAHDGPTGNIIYQNDFLNNGYQAADEGVNQWYYCDPDSGNFWSDYTGEDGDGDGIGDTPYPIPGGSNVDPYPVLIRNNHRCGDVNYSWQVDIDDVVYLIAYIFTGGDAQYPGTCIGDANGSGGVDIDDVIHVLLYIFGIGAAPAADCCEGYSW